MSKKEFPTLVVASTVTGFALGALKGGFAAIHECAEYLLGGPVWTHEFVHEPTMMEIQEAAYAQFPNLPTRAEAEADWQAAADKAVDAYGATLSVSQGTFRRKESPMDTVRAVAPHVQIIPISTAGDAS